VGHPVYVRVNGQNSAQGMLNFLHLQSRNCWKLFAYGSLKLRYFTDDKVIYSVKTQDT